MNKPESSTDYNLFSRALSEKENKNIQNEASNIISEAFSAVENIRLHKLNALLIQTKEDVERMGNILKSVQRLFKKNQILLSSLHEEIDHDSNENENEDEDDERNNHKKDFEDRRVQESDVEEIRLQKKPKKNPKTETKSSKSNSMSEDRELLRIFGDHLISKKDGDDSEEGESDVMSVTTSSQKEGPFHRQSSANNNNNNNNYRNKAKFKKEHERKKTETKIYSDLMNFCKRTQEGINDSLSVTQQLLHEIYSNTEDSQRKYISESRFTTVGSGIGEEFNLNFHPDLATVFYTKGEALSSMD